MRVSPEEQQKFASALEMHASEISGDEWHLIASDMNWPLDQVKTYAFWYFHQLTQEVQNEKSGSLFVDTLDGDGTRNESDTGMKCLESEEESNWTYEECVLFDNLLLRFQQEDTDSSGLRWKKISTMIPKKDVNACKQRYERYFRSTSESSGK